MSANPQQLIGFTVRLSRDEHKALTQLAEQEHRSLGAQGRKAIIEHLERHAAEDPAELAA